MRSKGDAQHEVLARQDSAAVQQQHDYDNARDLQVYEY